MDSVLKGQVQSFLDNRNKLSLAIAGITLGSDPTDLFKQFAEFHAELLMLALTYSAMVPQTQQEMREMLDGASVEVPLAAEIAQAQAFISAVTPLRFATVAFDIKRKLRVLDWCSVSGWEQALEWHANGGTIGDTGGTLVWVINDHNPIDIGDEAEFIPANVDTPTIRVLGKG